jgi:hypothetical protein
MTIQSNAFKLRANYPDSRVFYQTYQHSRVSLSIYPHSRALYYAGNIKLISRLGNKPPVYKNEAVNLNNINYI